MSACYEQENILARPGFALTLGCVHLTELRSRLEPTQGVTARPPEHIVMCRHQMQLN